MIAPLRRRHLRMWIVIAPLILIGAVAAYEMAPVFPADNFSEKTIGFPEMFRSIVNENYMFSLRKNFSGGVVLEVNQISKINPASELVKIRYRKPQSKNETTQVLGIMGGNRTYYFNLGSIGPPFEVTVIDSIRNATLADIRF